MTIDKKFVDQFINVTTKAALASSYFVGKKDKTAADKAAVRFNEIVNSIKLDINGKDCYW